MKRVSIIVMAIIVVFCIIVLMGCEGTPLDITLSFDSNGGSEITAIVIEESATITIPANPTKSGYTFSGWYLDNTTFTQTANSLFTSGLTEDTTIYAEWEVELVATEGLLFSLKDDDTYEVVGYNGTDLNVNIPETYLTINVTSIGSMSITTQFESLHLSANLTAIDEVMFGYSALDEITVAEGSTSYSSLDGVLFDKEMKELVWYPVAKGVTYTVPDGIERIGQGCFRDSTTIESITLPDSLITIEDKAFWGTTSLTSIVIPDNVTNIGWNAFYVAGLQSVVLGNSVSVIEDNAFSGCEMSSIIFPASITSIGKDAFAICNNLVSITVLASTPPLLVDSDSFRSMYLDGYNEGLEIYVPASNVGAYQAATSWSNYVDIITNIPE